MTQDEALLRLGESTAEAVAGILEMFAAGRVTAGDVAVAPPDRDPMDGISAPAVATSVSYVDGVTGGNVFVMTVEGARKLAAAMMGMDPDAIEPGEELGDLELSAVAEAMNQMMASAAGATSAVLGTEVEISPPETRVLQQPTLDDDWFQPTPHAAAATIAVYGEPCRFVQLIPSAFRVRMTRALDDIGAAGIAAGSPLEAGLQTEVLAQSLSGVPMRVWAELGRARMPAAQVVRLPAGVVIDLDKDVDEPVDLYVNGLPFARGRLVVSDGSDWAVQIESVVGED